MAQENYIQSSEKINLTKIPEYFVLSAASLFPNRHYLSSINSITGYTPLIPKIFNKKFPMDSVGNFKNTNYITEYYDTFKIIGVKYYLFPTKNKVEKLNLEQKNQINDFFIEKGFKKIDTIKNSSLYEEPNSKKFIYFTNEKNKISKINYTPSKIILNLDLIEDDDLIINQLYNENWEIIETNEKPKIYEELVQKYKITKDTKTITIKYTPPYFIFSIITSILGLFIFLIYSFKYKTWKY